MEHRNYCQGKTAQEESQDSMRMLALSLLIVLIYAAVLLGAAIYWAF